MFVELSEHVCYNYTENTCDIQVEKRQGVETSMCMTFVAGKMASVTGRVLVGHNEDDAGHTVVRHGYVPAMEWPEGTLIPAEEGRAKIPQVGHTFGYHWSELAGPEGGYPWGDAFLNECGVCVTSNNCSFSKEENPDLTDGGMAYNLRRMVAERAGSAREGMMALVDLVETWGYAPSGRTYIVADKDEAFVVQIVSGKRYAGFRLPDDHVLVLPNHYTLCGLDDYEEMFFSPDLVDYAFEQGWYDPARDGKFEFAKVFQAEKSWRKSLNVLRHKYSLEKLLGRAWNADKDGFPCTVKMEKKLSVEDIMALLSDHYEGAVDDIRSGPGRSPHDTPNCRVCGADTAESFVCDFHENPKLTTMWTAFGRPCELPYLPLHPLNGLPEALRTISDPVQAMADHLKPTGELVAYRDTVWQRWHDLSNAIEMVYEDVIKDVAQMKRELHAKLAKGNFESVRDAEEKFDARRLIDEDSARLEEACRAVDGIRLNVVEVAGAQPAVICAGKKARIEFVCESEPMQEKLVLGACRVRNHNQYAQAAALIPLGEHRYAAEFEVAPMLEWTGKGVHESFLGGMDANGRAFVAKIMIDVQ